MDQARGAAVSYPVRSSPLLALLRVLSRALPGTDLKTFFYLNCIDTPRRLLRLALTTFYRYDHVYAVLREFKSRYAGKFSILEFGTSDGYSFTKILYATKYLGMQGRVTCHAFDTFVGMPAPQGDQDRDHVAGDTWVEGQFAGRYEVLERYCASRYENYRLHKGLFEDTLTPAFLASLRQSPPILVWIDCDYYSSARSALEKLIGSLPNGCVIYFDEYEQLNFGSRFTGEAKLVHEINHGPFGDDIELVLDTELSLNTKRIYRFIRYGSSIQYAPLARENARHLVRYRSNDSPFP
jgi:hypothetical protein